MLEFCGLDLRSAEGGRLGNWLAAMEQRESVQTSSPERRLFLQALKSAPPAPFHKPWHSRCALR